MVNSSASSVTTRARIVIQKALSADHEVSMVETSRRGHATRLAQGAAARGVDVVVALGGDGTLNEAANGIAGTDTALAALPGGSTNVFARTIGLPDDPVEATASLLDALGAGSIERVGLGSVNGRYFLFNVGVGFDAAIVARVEQRSSLKRYASHAWFVWCGVDTWARHYDRAHPHFAVHHEDGTIIDDGYMALCLNTDPYTYMGPRPLRIAPGTDLDSTMCLVTVRSLGLATVGSILVRSLFGNRGVRTSRRIDRRSVASHAIITGHGRFPYQVDGEYLGETTRLELRHEPAIMNLVLPRVPGEAPVPR